MSDTWEISMINPVADERVGLRIILASSSPGEIGADFFCGAGTTLAVAERPGRRWIGCDLSKFAISGYEKEVFRYS